MDIENIEYALPEKLFLSLKEFNNNKTINEIRFRVNKPLVVVSKNERCILTCGRDDVLVTKDDLSVIFDNLCEHSLYSRENMISNGYISMRNGCRAGVCGSFSEKDYNLQDIQSLNIRIAKQVADADLPIYFLLNKKVKSVLISGPPCSGKTTVLRELCRRYSNMLNNVCILDEKGEIAGDFDIGACTDVISYRNKVDSAGMALKFMNPDIIAFDELADDANTINQCVKCGVKVFATIHSDSIDDVCARLKKIAVDIDDFDLIVQLNKNTFAIEDSRYVGGVTI